MRTAKSKKFTVLIKWWTGDEMSYHMVKVSAPKPIGARYVAIEKLRRENDIGEIGDNKFWCQGVYAGHLRNLWVGL